MVSATSTVGGAPGATHGCGGVAASRHSPANANGPPPSNTGSCLPRTKRRLKTTSCRSRCWTWRRSCRFAGAVSATTRLEFFSRSTVLRSTAVDFQRCVAPVGRSFVARFARILCDSPAGELVRYIATDFDDPTSLGPTRPLALSCQSGAATLRRDHK